VSGVWESRSAVEPLLHTTRLRNSLSVCTSHVAGGVATTSKIGCAPNRNSCGTTRNGEVPTNTHDALKWRRSSERLIYDVHKSNFYSLEYDVRSRLSLTDMDWTEPGEQDMARLLRSTPDSIETIIAAAQWGIEISNYWFKPMTKGFLKTFTDFCNAYAPISKQYKDYQAKAKKGAAV